MTTTTVTRTLIAETCISCGVLFGVTTEYQRHRKNDHRSYVCPNGHSQYWPAENDVEKAQREAKEAQQRAANEKARADRLSSSLTHTRDQLQATERSRSALKGQVTKIKKRIVAGTCPVGCRRHFADLQAHVETKHPGYDWLAADAAAPDA